jgi:Fe2+ or Zn2+ uptake regulation protein
MSKNFATKTKTKLTAHQLDVLRIIIAGNPDTAPDELHADLDQVLERVKRETTKSSIQFTVRALVVNQMIEKLPQVQRRGRLRVCFKATALGLAIGGDRTAPTTPAYLEPEGMEGIDV